MTRELEAAKTSTSWPFVEARRLVTRLSGELPSKGHVLFQTGYGPSGLPHIGTFGEVARTSMVLNAFSYLAPEIPTRLFTFSDDLDGLRKVPDNLPNPESLEKHLGKPLTSIPDPYGQTESYGDYMNARLCAFLDHFDFDFEFKSATDLYRSGYFNSALLEVLAHYDEIMAVMLPTLGPERRETYSPFMPICPNTGRVLQVPIITHDLDAGTVTYRSDKEKLIEVPVTNGNCKLQWKPDWAMRWYALGVDYEMSGKDLIDSVKQAGRIVKLLGGLQPEGFSYELFLDENGEKISKSRGNGLTIDEWLRYASPASLSHFMFKSPRKAKRLYFDIIPRTVDDYLGRLSQYQSESTEKRLANPLWHIHLGKPPIEKVPLGYGLLLNLASVCNADDKAVLWGFVSRYADDATPESHAILDSMVDYALNYYRDVIKPKKCYRAPTIMEHAALDDLARTLGILISNSTAEEIQNKVYEVGKRHDFPSLRAWFRALYEILLGQTEGPRMGSFICLYGLTETISLIERVLSGDDLAKDFPD